VIVNIDHIGIAVNNIEDAVKPYIDALGLKVEEIETLEEHKVKLAMIPIGESRIEFLQPTDSEGPIAKYIEKRGEGIHHLALEVSDIQGMLKILKEKGVPLINTEPIIGAGGARCAFLYPNGAKVLIELVEH